MWTIQIQTNTECIHDEMRCTHTHTHTHTHHGLVDVWDPMHHSAVCRNVAPPLRLDLIESAHMHIYIYIESAHRRPRPFPWREMPVNHEINYYDYYKIVSCTGSKCVRSRVYTCVEVYRILVVPLRYSFALQHLHWLAQDARGWFSVIRVVRPMRCMRVIRRVTRVMTIKGIRVTGWIGVSEQ